jgi:hypothetical protein
LATPCPRKSPEVSGNVPSGLGTVWLIAAPWTKPTNASEIAGSSSVGTSPSAGRTGRGRLAGMSAMSRSWRTASNSPTRSASAEVIATATRSPSERSRVRSSATISTIVATPISTVGQWRENGLNSVSIARVSRFPRLLSYPVRLGSWPSTMLTATAFTNPVSTAFGTNRTSDPRRSTPRTSITAPVNTPRVASARAGSSAARSSGTSAISTAIAPVACTDISTELVANAPATVPTR